jgi:hypothetical protein
MCAGRRRQTDRQTQTHTQTHRYTERERREREIEREQKSVRFGKFGKFVRGRYYVGGGMAMKRGGEEKKWTVACGGMYFERKDGRQQVMG